jgi:toxin FitB
VILLDTNIISETWRPERNMQVERWLDAQPSSTLFVSTITMAELHFGAWRLLDGRKKESLLKIIANMATDTFAERVLSFDVRCASAAGKLLADRERLGRPILFADAAIAGTALAYGLRLATRNLRDFDDTGIDLINPFDV